MKNRLLKKINKQNFDSKMKNGYLTRKNKKTSFKFFVFSLTIQGYRKGRKSMLNHYDVKTSGNYCQSMKY